MPQRDYTENAAQTPEVPTQDPIPSRNQDVHSRLVKPSLSIRDALYRQDLR